MSYIAYLSVTLHVSKTDVNNILLRKSKVKGELRTPSVKGRVSFKKDLEERGRQGAQSIREDVRFC